jgi:hypothetical protein
LESSSIVKDAGDGASELDDEGGGSSAIVWKKSFECV